MSRWRDRIEGLLYEGEAVVETVELDGASVVVTSHRVLAFTPDLEGPNFRGVERPNVTGVSAGARAEAALLERTVKFGVVGAVLVVAGQVVDFGGIVGDVDLSGGQAAGQVGIGGILGPLQSMLDVLRNLDGYMQVAGALALLLAVVLGGVYWYLRESTLVVEVEGENDLHVPRPDDDGVAQRLERAIALDPSQGDGGPAGDRTRSAGDGRGGPLGER